MNPRVYVARSSLSSLSHSWGCFCFIGQFCAYPCDDPSAQAIEHGVPPNRTSSVPNPDTPIFSNANAKRDAPSHEGEDLLDPPYAIDNAAGVLSGRTAYVGLSLLTCDMKR